MEEDIHVHVTSNKINSVTELYYTILHIQHVKIVKNLKFLKSTFTHVLVLLKVIIFRG